MEIYSLWTASFQGDCGSREFTEMLTMQVEHHLLHCQGASKRTPFQIYAKYFLQRYSYQRVISDRFYLPKKGQKHVEEL